MAGRAAEGGQWGPGCCVQLVDGGWVLVASTVRVRSKAGDDDVVGGATGVEYIAFRRLNRGQSWSTGIM